MTRDQRYMSLISILVEFTRDLLQTMNATPLTLKAVENVLTRVEKFAKEI